MLREPLRDTPEDDALVYRLFKRGDDTAEIARLLRVPEATVEHALHRAREAKWVEERDWQAFKLLRYPVLAIDGLWGVV